MFRLNIGIQKNSNPVNVNLNGGMKEEFQFMEWIVQPVR